MTGKLIIIEAGDGCGKATQTKMLYERLQNEYPQVRKIEFPDYEADGSMAVRMYLRGDFGQTADAVNAYAASTFFAVDRYASFQLKWRTFYEAGGIVIADRYTTSNMVHQVVKIRDEQKRTEFLNWLDDFEFHRLGLPTPSIVIFLDMPPHVAHELLLARANANHAALDIHERDEKYLEECYLAYKDIAKRYGWTSVNCAENAQPLPMEIIHENIYRAVKEILD